MKVRKCRSSKIGEVSFLISTFRIAKKVNAERPLWKRVCRKIRIAESWKVEQIVVETQKKPRIWVSKEGLTKKFGCQEGFKVPPCSEVHVFDLRGGKNMPPR